MPAGMVKLEASWLAHLQDQFEQPYMTALGEFLRAEKRAGKRLFPAGSELFSAFDHTPLEQVKVVILGQDPYHGEGQAHGLCFSVRPGVPVPPSLQNIYKEIRDELGLPIPAHGDLTHWADQGVLLLNTALSVPEGDAGGHAKLGWSTLTTQVLQHLDDRACAFLLWGKHAQKVGQAITQPHHLKIETAHPSPLSARRGFFGSRPFSRVNAWLEERGGVAIQWS